MFFRDDTNSTNPTNDSDTKSGSWRMRFCIEVMSLYYMSLAIADEDIKVKAIVSVIVCIFGIFVNLVLLNGSAKKRKGNMLPWLILTMFHLVLDLFVRASLIVISYYDPKGWILVQESIGSGIFMYIFGFYFWDIVLSRYRDIKNNPNDDLESKGSKSSSSSSSSSDEAKTQKGGN